MKQIFVLKLLNDLAAICVAWILSYYLRFYAGLEVPLGIPEPVLYFKLLPFICGIWALVFILNGFYRRSEVHRSAVIEGLDTIQSCVIATIAFISFTYFYEEYRYSRITTFIFAVIHPILIITGRSLLRKALRRRHRRGGGSRMLIIATSEKAIEAYKLCTRNRYEFVCIAGVVLLDQPDDDTAQFFAQQHISIYKNPNDWVGFLMKDRIASILIAIDETHLGFLTKNLEAIAEQVPRVRILPEFGRFSKLGMGIDVLGGRPVINIHESPLQGSALIVKRVMDVLVSTAALLILSPIMLIIAALVKLSSPGPIFYRQERMGLDGESFFCLKFRSMPIDAEAQTGAVFATAEDNRATKIGAMLRKTSLDELPQLLNVLRGDMSIVGPRPERPVFVNKFRRDIPGYMLRHKVKAGITGWAQVNGWRGNTSIEKRIECDLFYIQNWSLWLDFKILLLTIDEVLTGRNAY